MKKLLFIIPLLFLICACTKLESSCKIGEYDCWEIIQNLKETKIENRSIKYEEYAKLPASQRAEMRKKRFFSNPALEAKGLSVISQYGLWNGDHSTTYTLSNGVNIVIDKTKKQYAIVKIPEISPKSNNSALYQKIFVYDIAGNIISFKANAK